MVVMLMMAMTMMMAAAVMQTFRMELIVIPRAFSEQMLKSALSEPKYKCKYRLFC